MPAPLIERAMPALIVIGVVLLLALIFSVFQS